MAIRKLIIAYSGSLDAYQPATNRNLLSGFKQWFWTYKHDTVDSSTRSAYYLIKAIGILKAKFNITPEQLQCNFWGKIHPLNALQSEQEGVSEFFKFEGYLNKELSLRKLNEADVLFLPLEISNTPGIGTLFIPGKLFEYLHAAKPILALCEASDCRTILETSGLGICTNPDNPEKIAEMINKMLNDAEFLNQFQGNSDYISTFSFKNKTEELAQVFNSLIVK
jgi:glycosyltransferase involved in cell wall biosynthesis